MKNYLCQSVAARVNELRGEMSVSELADRSEVSRSTVDALLNGRVDNVTIDTIARLCDVLGVSIQEFFNSTSFDK